MFNFLAEKLLAHGPFIWACEEQEGGMLLLLFVSRNTEWPASLLSK